MESVVTHEIDACDFFDDCVVRGMIVTNLLVSGQKLLRRPLIIQIRILEMSETSIS
jgi:hypothetical protein